MKSEISEKEFDIIVKNNANPKVICGTLSFMYYITLGWFTNPTIARLVWEITKKKFNSNV